MPHTIEVEIDLDDFNDYEVLEYTYNLIKNDRDKRDYFVDLSLSRLKSQTSLVFGLKAYP